MRYKVRLVDCGNEENDFHDASVSPVTDYIIVKMATCKCLLQGWKINHLYFDNASPNGRLARPVYCELRKYAHSDAERSPSGMMLNKSFYGLKDAVKKWNRFPYN